MEKLSNPQYQAEISRFIKSLGIGGPILLIFVQFIQVIIAFIPGGPFEILTGALYGAYGGLIICLIGSMSASALIFKLSKKHGKRILYFFFSKEKIAKWEWLKDSKKTDIAVFILFLIPGTPKDMLTYIVGISDMGLLKFIIISSLARIPALFSSALIGTTMRHGDIKKSLLIFIIIGIVGIIGICIKDTALKKCKSEKKTIEKLQGLDILQTIYMDRLYPLIYCHIRLDVPINIKRLRAAVEYTRKYVPEICYSYNAQNNCFTNCGYNTDKIFNTDKFTVWNLENDTQLKIFYSEDGRNVIIGISHILCDGNGFLQYLYMLSDFYNDRIIKQDVKNIREITPLMKDANIKYTKIIPKFMRCKLPKNIGCGKQSDCRYIKEIISEDDFHKIHSKTKRCGLSINDVFAAVYGNVMCDRLNQSHITVRCPVNLRNFAENKKTLTVANMTGIYYITVKRKEDITKTAECIHYQIEQQHRKFSCFRGIKALDWICNYLPPSVSKFVCSKFYHIPAVSYSNIGIIDCNKLTFNEHIRECFLSSAYRHTPYFQLTISTYNNVCTLTCSTFDNADSCNYGIDILKSVKNRLLQWIDI